MLSSYVWLRIEKSFWQETGSGHPSRTHAAQSIVMPYAFSLDTPQCLTRPASMSSFIASTVRSKSSALPSSKNLANRLTPPGVNVGVDMMGVSLLGQWIWYRSTYSHPMRSMDFLQEWCMISESYP